jgi:hypothetical protein
MLKFGETDDPSARREPRRWWCVPLISALACAGSAGAQSARLELRIVPQSGVPGPGSCVYHDPPTPLGGPDPPVEAVVSPGIARRMEVQYRLTDAASGRPLPSRGLRSLRLDVRAGAAGSWLWARPLLSIDEGDAMRSSRPAAGIDCSGLPAAPAYRPRGLHGPFRAALSGADPNEDVDNGAFSSAGLAGIHALAGGPPDHLAVGDDDWFGLYSFEFVPPAGFAGTLSIIAAPAASTFDWFGAAGTINTGTLVTAGVVTVRGPASAAACCARLACFVAVSPSACFAAGGFIAAGNVCGPATPASCCFADFNRDGAVSVQDLFDFLIAYQRGSATADLNASGSLTVQDVFDFLSAYFVGCGN